MASQTTYPSTSRTIYNARANHYDNSFHSALALNYIDWIHPEPGQHVLDLACGTGLVALPAKSAVGRTGTVTAIDVSDGMMTVGKQKAEKAELDVEWIEWDIGDLQALQREEILREEGYDIITCAAALLLLDDPGAAVKQWTSLLKKGGRLIADVHTERSYLAGALFEEVGKELGIAVAWSTAWVKDQGSLEKLFLDAGLEIEKAWKAPGYSPANVYGGEEGGKFFDRVIDREMHAAFWQEGVKDKARRLFVEKFRKRAGEDGLVREENAFYLVIGRKP
ncbi:hypothetical protein MMC13_000956 [Lambiella insularis]|nr:hypothetical protein [Lambiella insularis]